MERFPSKTGKKVRTVLATSVQHCTEVSSQCNKKLKAFIQIGREGEKYFYLRMMMYIENPKESVIKILDFMSLARSLGYEASRINTQKSMVFLCTSKK